MGPELQSSYKVRKTLVKATNFSNQKDASKTDKTIRICFV